MTLSRLLADRSRPLVTLCRVVVAIAVFLFLPATNVLLVCSPAFVAHEYGRPHVSPADYYDPATRLELSQATVRWLNSNQGIDGLAALQHNGEPIYNARELRHMDDVKVVMDGLRWVWRGALVILLGAVALAAWRPAWRRPCIRGVLAGGVALAAVLAGILIGALLSFDTFFVNFHQVFFQADTWTFNYSDTLIQFYPLEFWMDATWILGAATLVEGLLVGAAAFLVQRRLGRKAQPNAG